MNRAISYLAVGIIAFVAGGAAYAVFKPADKETNPVEAREGEQPAKTPTQRTFAIEGMHCESCSEGIQEALVKIPGVQAATVSFGDKRASVNANPEEVSDEKIEAAIIELGYQVPSAAASSKTARTAASEKPPILVNITRGKNDVHAVSMAIGLAQSALEDGRKAAVFLNVEAPVFAAKDLSEDLKCADFPPIKKMLVDFLDHGGQVLICGHCASVVDLKKENVIERAKLTGHGDIFAELKPGTIVFSY